MPEPNPDPSTARGGAVTHGEGGLIHACVLDGRGGGRFGGWEVVRAWKPEDGILWVHLDFSTVGAREWLEKESGLDAIARSALLASESRPRSVLRGDALLVDLRGVNLNPGAQPDDMVSVRLELQGQRIITARRRRLRTLQDVREKLERGEGPTDTGDFLVAVADGLLLRMADAFAALDDRIDGIQERIPKDAGASLRSEIADVRNQVIALRRYMAPQREAIARLQVEKAPWLTPLHREQLRELADRTTRRVEDLEAARDRASVSHEELSGRMAEQMNRTMYILSLVASIFLPLGLLTGLLGINVGGMPGADEGAAFWIVCLLLVVLAVGQFLWFKRRNWI